MEKEKIIPTIVIAIIIVIAGGFLLRGQIAAASWFVFKNPTLTLLLDPDASRALSIGDYYFNTNGRGAYDLEKARFYFEKALSLDSNVPDAWHQLARIDFLESHFDGALSKINTQIEMHGDSFMASFYMRGLIHAYRKEYAEAEQDFLQFLSWDKKNWAAHNDLAWIYFEQGKFKEAKQAAHEGLLFDANNPWLWNMVGVSLMNLGKPDVAGAAFLKALEEARTLTEDDWHMAYPGNNPMLAGQGLEKIKGSIQYNLDLVSKKL